MKKPSSMRPAALEVPLLHAIKQGSGTPIVFLHGMAGSSRYWNRYVDELAKRHTVLAVDLLGFGRSSHRAKDYTLEAHLASLHATIDQYIGTQEPIMLVGHSMGALIGTAYARRYPDAVARLVLLNPPVYRTPLESRTDITRGKWQLRVAYYGTSSRLLCTVWCRGLRPLSRRVAPFYLKPLPSPVAQDSVLHSWRSYSHSLHHIIEHQHLTDDLDALTIPVEIVYATRERAVVRHNTEALRTRFPGLRFHLLDGTHHLPLEQPAAIMSIIAGSPHATTPTRTDTHHSR